MDDIEMREAQLLLATLERQWDDDRNRSFALMEELNTAEKRLLALFSGEWKARGGERRMINLAYSEFRKRLMLAFRLPARRANADSRSR
jgi:hypothetical protein